jgi:hypothetical protein
MGKLACYAGDRLGLLLSSRTGLGVGSLRFVLFRFRCASPVHGLFALRTAARRRNRRR